MATPGHSPRISHPTHDHLKTQNPNNQNPNNQQPNSQNPKMSQAIHTILRAASSVTDLLADGADSVMHLMETQGEPNPYICIDDDSDPLGTFENTVTEEELNLTITIISDWRYTTGANVGAWNIGRAVKAVLEVASGTYGTEEIKKINFTGETTQFFPKAGKDKVLVEQEYQVFVKR